MSLFVYRPSCTEADGHGGRVEGLSEGLRAALRRPRADLTLLLPSLQVSHPKFHTGLHTLLPGPSPVNLPLLLLRLLLLLHGPFSAARETSESCLKEPCTTTTAWRGFWLANPANAPRPPSPPTCTRSGGFEAELKLRICLRLQGLLKRTARTRRALC